MFHFCFMDHVGHFKYYESLRKIAWAVGIVMASFIEISTNQYDGIGIFFTFRVMLPGLWSRVTAEPPLQYWGKAPFSGSKNGKTWYVQHASPLGVRFPAFFSLSPILWVVVYWDVLPSIGELTWRNDCNPKQAPSGTNPKYFFDVQFPYNHMMRRTSAARGSSLPQTPLNPSDWDWDKYKKAAHEADPFHYPAMLCSTQRRSTWTSKFTSWKISKVCWCRWADWMQWLPSPARRSCQLAIENAPTIVAIKAQLITIWKRRKG